MNGQSDDERLARAIAHCSEAIFELVTAIRQLPSQTDGLAACLDRAEAAAREAVVMASGVDKGSLREEADIVAVTKKTFQRRQQ